MRKARQARSINATSEMRKYDSMQAFHEMMHTDEPKEIPKTKTKNAILDEGCRSKERRGKGMRCGRGALWACVCVVEKGK